MAAAVVISATALGRGPIRNSGDLDRECAAGLRFSCAALGMRYRYGDGVPLDRKRAYDYLGGACRAGLLYACGYAGEMAIAGECAGADREEGARMLRAACAEGDAYSCIAMRRHGIEATRSGRALRD
jgi:TPR repeat protein